MSPYNVPVLVLLCTIARIYSICPEVSLPGDPSCKAQVQDDTLASDERVLFDNHAFRSSPWIVDQGVPGTIACKNTVLICAFGAGRARVDFPELNISNVDNFAVNITGRDFLFLTDRPVVELCVRYSRRPLRNRAVGTTCFQVTSNTGPKELSVPRNMNYAYLVLREPNPPPIAGFCVNIMRATVKYRVCPCKVENLVLFPETGRGSSATVSSQCVENAATEDNLAVNTTTCSSQVEGAQCYCNPGYEKSGSTCKACEENTFSTGGGASCQPCPFNTESGVASSSCDCVDGHYRSTSQGECFSVPSAPRDLVQIAKSANSFTLTWMCPETGDWNRLYYTVCHKLESPGSQQVCMDVSQGDQCLNQYTMTRLEPFTSYKLSVTSHNHVSHLGMIREATIKITAKTDEGMPGLPTLKRLCTVVIWKPPVEPRGVLKFYELRFIDARGQEEMHIYDSTENFHLTSIIQMEQNVRVQLRVNNSKAYSEWVPTEPEPIDCAPGFECPPVPECNCPTVAEVVSTTEEVTTTMEPVTTTEEPVAITEEPVSTTMEPEPTTQEPTTITTQEPTTQEPTTQKPTTHEPTTKEPTTKTPTTQEPTTQEPTTQEPTTEAPTVPSACAAYTVCSATDGVSISHGGNDGIISVMRSAIGEGDDAVQCCTGYPQLLNQQRVGEMTYPNGTYVGRRADKEPYYRNRRANCVRLNTQSSTLTAPLGMYGCVIPNNVGTMCCMPFSIQ